MNQLIQFENLADHLSEGVYITNQNGEVLFVNTAFTEITGFEKDSIIGVQIQSYLNERYHLDTYDRIDIEKNAEGESYHVYSGELPDALYTMVIAQKKPITYTGILVIEGRAKQILFNGYPIYNEYHQIKYVFVTMQDLSSLEALNNRLVQVEQENIKHKEEIDYLRGNVPQNQFIGETESMIKIKSLITKIAPTDVTVLLTGETGVGKEVAAKAIHDQSKRAMGPYIKINCAAIPEALLESELFGYEKGAFSGAKQMGKMGHFELANGGTLLLDEIGEMPMALQTKLLRVLQENELMRVGGTKPISLDVRIIASTNLNLEESVKNGQFRQDLYYRINVIPIELPPLRERNNDIALLTDYILNQLNQKYNKHIKFTTGAYRMLNQYDWPGNVRELKNILERLVITQKDGYMDIDRFSQFLPTPTRHFFTDMLKHEHTLKELIEDYERVIIETTLQTYGNMYVAAAKLGVTQSTISRKAKKLGIKYW